ncbi:hypothetical protein [Conexibacter sp. SYSU D00693]|uniref:hypothetical protein n=1 Tax=Conexibacter sp. SYSU D00693 TaxID=2812560 RepID=UPI00196A3259|nr:hypothetical protein [Conexibacter sp. SYSU D00693]
MRRALVALLCALASVLALPAAAHALLLEPADATELANDLADAFEAQGVCYGWEIRLSDQGSPSQQVGSSFGPDQPLELGDARCTKGSVKLDVDVTYTSESSESEDSATFVVLTDRYDEVALTDGLRALGFGDGDLLGGDDDTAVVNMAGALPALVADQAGLPYVPFEPTTQPAAQQGTPTNSPGSDFLRENGTTLGLGLVLLVGGVAWFFWARRKERRTAPPPRTTPATTSTTQTER